MTAIEHRVFPSLGALALIVLGFIGFSSSVISCTNDCAIGKASDAVASFYDEEGVPLSIDRVEWTFFGEHKVFVCSEGETCTAAPLVLETRDKSGTLTLVVEAAGFQTVTVDVWIESDGCHPVGDIQIPIVLTRVDEVPSGAEREMACQGSCQRITACSDPMHPTDECTTACLEDLEDEIGEDDSCAGPQVDWLNCLSGLDCPTWEATWTELAGSPCAGQADALDKCEMAQSASGDAGGSMTSG